MLPKLKAPDLQFPEAELALPKPPPPGDDGDDSEYRRRLAEAIDRFAHDAIEKNSNNLAQSLGYLSASFHRVSFAYAAMITFGLIALVAAVVKGLFAGTGAQTAAAGVIGAVSVTTLISAFVLKPVESMERNAVLMPWLLLVLNTYWTRLAYFDDPEEVDEQLRGAAEDAARQFAQIADTHAAALEREQRRVLERDAGGDD